MTAILKLKLAYSARLGVVHDVRLGCGLLCAPKVVCGRRGFTPRL